MRTLGVKAMMSQQQFCGHSGLGCRISRLQLPTALRLRAALRGIDARNVPTCGVEYLSPFACSSDPRGRTKWYGVYTEEQYQAQRQSEERARWAAGVRTLTGNQSQAAWGGEGSQLDPPALLSGVTVVIISPRKPVTVGTVARACGSFECEDLRIVMPRQESYITRHAKGASKGAQYILYRAGHYDSIAEATADCDVRIAFTRWAQASSPHVYKVDINGLTGHPAVQRVIREPLQPAAAVADAAAAATASRPPSAPWTEAAAAAAAAVEARLASPPSASAATASSSDASGDDDEGDEHEDGEERRRQQQRGVRGGEGPSGGGSNAAASSSAAHQKQQHSKPPHLQDQLQDSQPGLNDFDARAVYSTSSSTSGNGSGLSAEGSAAAADLTAAVGRPVGRLPRVALVFGREELGMSDEEVDSCEVCCSIPIGRLQESLSLSHAVSIALCGLYQARLQHLATATSAEAAGVAATAAGAPAGQATMALGAGAADGQTAAMASGEPSTVSYKVDASTGAVRSTQVAAAAVWLGGREGP